jgi:hypothetical protein
MRPTILNARLQGINDAQKRAGVAFLALILASGAIIASLWNIYLSWDRQWAELPTKPATWAQEQLMAEQIRSWMQTNTVDVSLLGIRLSVSDVAVVGSIVLLMLSFYYCMCMRGVNHGVGSLLLALKEDTVEVKQVAFFSIRSSMIFTTGTENDAPYAELYRLPPSRKRIPFSGSVLKLLSYLPAITVLLIITSDIYFGFFYMSPWRGNQVAAWNTLTPNYRIQLVAMDTFALLVLLMIVSFCKFAAAFDESTRRITEQLGNESGDSKTFESDSGNKRHRKSSTS